MTREEEIAQRCEKATNDPLPINRADAYYLLQRDVLDIVPYLLGRVAELEATNTDIETCMCGLAEDREELFGRVKKLEAGIRMVNADSADSERKYLLELNKTEDLTEERDALREWQKRAVPHLTKHRDAIMWSVEHIPEYDEVITLLAEVPK